MHPSGFFCVPSMRQKSAAGVVARQRTKAQTAFCDDRRQNNQLVLAFLWRRIGVKPEGPPERDRIVCGKARD